MHVDVIKSQALKQPLTLYDFLRASVCFSSRNGSPWKRARALEAEQNRLPVRNIASSRSTQIAKLHVQIGEKLPDTFVEVKHVRRYQR